jgi:glycosyltransferase involved in cell wall biosynthesis
VPRVLELVTRMNIGGPARHVVHLARELAGQFDIDVTAGSSSAEEGTFSDARVPVRHIDLVREPSPALDLRALHQVRSRLRHGGYDIIHTHMAKAGTIGRIAALLSGRGVRTVHTFHGHVLEGYFSPAVQRAIVRTERWLARHTDVLVAVSEQTRDDLIQLGIGQPSQWRVIPPASDLNPFFRVTPTTKKKLRQRHGIPDGEFLVAALGRLAPIKDHETLVRAVAATDAHLLLCGDGPLAPKLQSLAEELGAGDRVHFHGWTDDAAEVLAQVDAVALTSRNEGTPLALIEAHAAGLPIVATDVGGVGDIVVPGETGFLVPTADPGAVAQALCRLAEDADLRVRYGAAGRARMADRYSSKSAIASLADLYASLL